MSLRFELDPELTDELYGTIVELWVEATNAGGAVGFVAPVTADELAPVARAALAGVADGIDICSSDTTPTTSPRCSSSPTTGSRSSPTGACSSG